MKIGILTYHRSHNYGTMLQAAALRRSNAEFGRKVKFMMLQNLATLLTTHSTHALNERRRFEKHKESCH